ncbi:MAG TPA: NCS2 family permease [Caulobacteraceae bacterium]|jgi:AGZA family xanthine/uracil permease-like MFS transporter
MTANVLERVFALRAHGTNLRTEVLAGFATFLTMVYIVAVNPAILGEAGLPVGAVAVATCLAAGFASLLMGLAANTPLALAPGMGLNAYFTYTVVKGMGVPWETALGCVFLSGAAFLVLTLAGVRQLIVGAIPRSLFAAVAGGIGLFIAFIGLKDAGVIVASPATTVALGDMASPTAALALIGLVLIAVLQAWRVKAAILIGIVAISLASWGLGFTHVSSAAFSLSDLSATAFKLDVPAALNLKGGLGSTLAEIVFVFLFVDLFDNVGTLVAVTKKAGLVAPDGTIPRLNRILLVDSLATMVGAAAGTSTVTSYIESAAGVASGGRTGLTSVVVGLLFFATLLLAPLVQYIPTAATAPALILVGAMMVGTVAEVDWNDPTVALPAFLILVTIPLTFSIANGLAFGVTAYALLQILTGKARAKDWLLYALSALFVARFIYLAKG